MENDNTKSLLSVINNHRIKKLDFKNSLFPFIKHLTTNVDTYLNNFEQLMDDSPALKGFVDSIFSNIPVLLEFLTLHQNSDSINVNSKGMGKSKKKKKRNKKKSKLKGGAGRGTYRRVGRRYSDTGEGLPRPDLSDPDVKRYFNNMNYDRFAGQRKTFYDNLWNKPSKMHPTHVKPGSFLFNLEKYWESFMATSLWTEDGTSQYTSDQMYVFKGFMFFFVISAILMMILYSCWSSLLNSVVVKEIFAKTIQALVFGVAIKKGLTKSTGNRKRPCLFPPD